MLSRACARARLKALYVARSAVAASAGPSRGTPRQGNSPAAPPPRLLLLLLLLPLLLLLLLLLLSLEPHRNFNYNSTMSTWGKHGAPLNPEP